MQQETNIFLFKREDECDSNNSSFFFLFFLQENFSYDKHFLFMILFFFLFNKSLFYDLHNQIMLSRKSRRTLTTLLRILHYSNEQQIRERVH